jgi:ribosomal protein S27E
MPFTIECSKCHKTLKVPDEAAGKKVRCPSCQEIIAVPASGGSSPDEGVTEKPAPPTPASSKPSSSKSGPAAWDTDDKVEDDDRPRTPTKKRDDFDFDDDRDRDRDRDDDDDRPRRRRDRDDDDDFDDLRRPRRIGAPHRGGTILTLGIVSILLACACACGGIILGAVVVNMANTDLAQMTAGRMDPSGQGNTSAGKICGIIAIILGIINAIAGAAIQMGNMKN